MDVFDRMGDLGGGKANSGGLVNIAEELTPGGCHQERARAAMRGIDATTARLATAETDAVSTAEAADRLPGRRVDDLWRTHQTRPPSPA